MRPMIGKKKWWETKPKDNQTDVKHYKNWCVLKRLKNVRHVPTKWGVEYEYEYIAVGVSNAPEYYNPNTGEVEKSTHVNNLTKEEAYAMAKMLNFVGEVEEISY